MPPIVMDRPPPFPVVIEDEVRLRSGPTATDFRRWFLRRTRWLSQNGSYCVIGARMSCPFGYPNCRLNATSS